MKKRIINFICVFAILAGLIPTNTITAQSGYDPTAAAQTLKELGIITDVSAKKATKDFYIKALGGFLYDEVNMTSDELARSTGMIESGEVFKGAEYVSADEAVKYAVITLGYKALAKEYGGDYNAYLKIASDLEIINGINVTEGRLPEMSDIIKLLYNMLEAEPMSSYYKSSEDMGYAINKDETLLSRNRDIYLVKGIHNANSYTSIYSEKGTKEGYIEIENIEFEYDGDTTEYLGKNVVAYAKEISKDEYKILYIGENTAKNEVLDIKAEDIESVYEDYSAIEYLKGDRIYKAKLSTTPSVIYNGVLYGEYKIEDLMPDVGGVSLIDNNSDGKFDVVKVTSYQTMVVDSVNQTDMIVKSRLDFENCLEEICLESDKYDIDYTITKNNIKIGLADILPYNVLSVARSKNEDGRLIRIFVSDLIVEGRIDSRDDEDKEIQINGVMYPMSQDFTEYIASGDKAVNVGENGILYIDAFGNAAYFKPTVSSDYYMILRTYEEDEKYYAIYMDINEEWKTGVFADKISLNGESVKTSVAYETELQYLKMEIVKLKENTSGELKKIELAEEGTKYKENKFTKTPEATYTYRYFEQHFDHTYYLNEGAKAFVLPESYTTDKTKYSVQTVTSLFDTDVSGCQLSAYDIDEFNFTDVISIKDNSAIENSRSTLNLFVVTSVGEMYLNDEVVYGITGNMVNYRNLSLAAEDASILKDVEVGDIIRLSINGAGQISATTHVASAKNFVPMEYTGYTTHARMAGTVSKLDIAEGKIKINFGANEKNFRLSTTLGVLTYNKDRNKCSFDDISSIAEGKKIICRLKMGRIEEIIVIDEEKR